METTFKFVRTTIRGALAVLVPILIVVFLGKKIYSAIRGALLGMSGWLPDAVPFRKQQIADLFVIDQAAKRSGYEIDPGRIGDDRDLAGGLADF